jgi:hypothetical protein
VVRPTPAACSSNLTSARAPWSGGVSPPWGILGVISRTAPHPNGGLQFTPYALEYSADQGRSIMRLTAIAIMVTTSVAAVSAAAQNAPPPAAAVRKVVAAAKLPAVTYEPLHFKVLGVTLSPGEKIDVSGANSVVYTLSGSASVSGLGESGLGETKVWTG